MALFALTKIGNSRVSWLLEHFLPVETFAFGGLVVVHFDEVLSMGFAKMIARRPAVSFTSAMLLAAALRYVAPFSWWASGLVVLLAA
jgi:hypothetical protein